MPTAEALDTLVRLASLGTSGQDSRRPARRSSQPVFKLGRRGLLALALNNLQSARRLCLGISSRG